MGDYSVHCCLSGLPIGYGQEVVGWNLQKTSFKNCNYEYDWLPKSIPVTGTYNNSGGIDNADGVEVLEGDGMQAICHKYLWDSLIEFWNPQDGNDTILCSIMETHKAYLSEKNSYYVLKDGLKKKNDKTYRYWDKKVNDDYMLAHMAMSYVVSKRNVTILRWLDKLYLGEPSKRDGVSYKVCKDWTYKNRSGEFEKKILDIVIAGDKYPNCVECCNMLRGLLMAYTSTYYRGRPILPTQMSHPEQYPDYKREWNWLGKVSFLANSLKNKKKWLS